jgi:transposase-like protein
MTVYLQSMLDEEKVYATVRELRWRNGQVSCPHCGATTVVKNGHHDTQKARQRYICRGSCSKQFDDLTGTVFEGHHQPLEVWILCLYLMGLNLSNQQIGRELGLDKDDVQAMTQQLREGVEAKKKSFDSKVV